eukprot:scaffold21839_cov65-Phaeocystis_antarctica.AAC.2
MARRAVRAPPPSATAAASRRVAARASAWASSSSSKGSKQTMLTLGPRRVRRRPLPQQQLRAASQRAPALGPARVVVKGQQPCAASQRAPAREPERVVVKEVSRLCSGLVRYALAAVRSGSRKSFPREGCASGIVRHALYVPLADELRLCSHRGAERPARRRPTAYSRGSGSAACPSRRRGRTARRAVHAALRRSSLAPRRSARQLGSQ